MMMRKLLILFSALIFSASAFSQQIKIFINDATTGQEVKNVVVYDVTNNRLYTTDSGQVFVETYGKDTVLLSINAFNYKYKQIKVANNSGGLFVYLQPLYQELAPIYVTAEAKTFFQSESVAIDSGYNEKTGKALQTIDDILSTTPAVNVIRPLGIYSNSPVVTVGAMGSAPARTAVYYDGIKLNKSDDGSVNWNMLDVNDVGSAMVGLSAQSALWGSGAMGGVISFAPACPKAGFSGKSELFIGSYGTAGLYGKVAKGKSVKDPMMSMSVSGKKSLGYVTTPDSLQYRGFEYYPAGMEEKRFNLTAGYKFDQTSVLKIYANIYDDYRSLGRKINEDNYTKHPSAIVAVKFAQNRRTSSLSAIVYLYREKYFKNIESQKSTYSLIYVNSLRQDAGADFSYEKRFSPYLIVDAGINTGYGSVFGQDVYQTSPDIVVNSGSILQSEMFLKATKYFRGWSHKLFVSLAGNGSFARVISPRFIIENPTEATDFMLDYTGEMPDNTLHVYSYSAWFGYLRRRVRIRLGASSGYTLPTLEDLTRSGFNRYGFKIANPQLKPEQINALTFESNIQVSNVTLNTTLIYKQGYDFMYYVQTGDFLFGGKKPVVQKQNVSRVDIATANVWFNYKGKFWGSYGGYSYAKSAIVSFSQRPDLEGKSLTYTPKHSVRLGIYGNYKKVSLALLGQYVSQMYEDDANTLAVPSHYQIDAKLTYTLNKTIKLQFSVDNVTDQRYIIYYDQLSIGRFYLLRLTYEF